MTAVNNGSFETGGTPDVWDAASWTTAVSTTSPEYAAFGENTYALSNDFRTTRELFETGWRLPDSRRLPAGDSFWAEYSFSGGFSPGPVTLAVPDAVVSPVLVTTEAISASPAAVFTVTYVDQDNVGGASAVVTIPDGTPSGVEFPIVLAALDYGFLKIDNITVVDLTGGSVEVHGGWMREPYNAYDPYYTLVYENVNFFGRSSEWFETGWGNDAGFKDSLGVVLPVSATWADGGPAETFGLEWRLPNITAGPPFVEDFVPEFHGFVDSAVLAFPLTLDVPLRIQWQAGGTDAPIDLTLTGTWADAAAIATALYALIGPAVNGDPGPVTDSDFTVTVVDGRIRIENLAVGFPMELLVPTADSLWVTAGFTTTAAVVRVAELDRVAEAEFGTPNNAYDAFETEWRTNEDYKSAFVGPPTDLAAATFDAGTPETVEDFEEEWVLVLG